MNISEALRKIKKLKGEIAVSQQRMKSSSCWIQGKEPTYSFKEVVQLLETQTTELVALESAVAEKNASTKVNVDGKQVSLSSIIRSLQEIKSKISLYEVLSIRTDKEVDRDRFYSQEEEKYVTEKVEKQWVSALTEIERDEKIKSLKEDFDKLNSILENENHKTQI